MPYRKAIQENLRFLVLDVRKQVEGALAVLSDVEGTTLERLRVRDDHIDNLKGVIESKCFSQRHFDGETGQESVNVNRAISAIALNLERIADFAVEIADQTNYYHDSRFAERFDYRAHFGEVMSALDLVYEGVINRDVDAGLAVCGAERRLDELYRAAFDEIRSELRKGEHTEDLITTLFVFRYLERMGDCLQNIGESIISAATGERLKFHQLQALEQALEQSSEKSSLGDFSLASIWETRSGCRVAHVEHRSDATRTPAIFKDGSLEKLRREKDNIERWERLCPGLPPKVLGFEETGPYGSLLLECVAGRTLEELLLDSGDGRLGDAVGATTLALAGVWERTLDPRPINADHFEQLQSRIEDVYRIHPDYRSPSSRIGKLMALSLDEMVGRSAHIERHLAAPFRTLIHGDLNIDNVIYDPETDRVRFIDLHRSREQDYTQDVSVFVVSSFRLPVTNPVLRRRLDWTIHEFMRFARGFARAHNDTTFDIRTALGLVRSFATSTRFELKEEFARSMYLRAVFLLEKILSHDGRPWEEFTMPVDALSF